MDHVRDRKEFQKCDARVVLQCFSHLKGDVGNGNSIKGGRHQSFLGLDWIGLMVKVGDYKVQGTLFLEQSSL